MLSNSSGATVSIFLHFLDVEDVFIHCFVEREVFLLTAAASNSSISSLEILGNLIESTICTLWVGAGFVSLLMDSESHGSGADVEEKLSNYSSNWTLNVGNTPRSTSSASRSSLSSLRNCKSLNSSIFAFAKRKFWQQKSCTKFARNIAFFFVFLQFGRLLWMILEIWLVVWFKCYFLIAWKKDAI